MSKSLFEQYQEAKEAWEQDQREKREEWEAEQKENRFEELNAIIEAEDLRLEKSDGKYIICTTEGDLVTDYLEDLDDVEAWLEDPQFVFDLDDDSDNEE